MKKKKKKTWKRKAHGTVDSEFQRFNREYKLELLERRNGFFMESNSSALLMQEIARMFSKTGNRVTVFANTKEEGNDVHKG